jgi:hypothetical protein
MKYFITVIVCSFLCACGDKDEDTGSDTAVVEDSAVVE